MSLFLALAVAAEVAGGVPSASAVADPCAVRSLTKSEVQGLRVQAPDGMRYAMNKKDERGVAQIYIGRSAETSMTCITCEPPAGAPRRERFKMQPHWHPSGRWLFIAVERDTFTAPPVLGWSRKYVEGQLQNGIWTDMWAVSPDGAEWHRLTEFKSGVKGTADGFTGPAFTPDGRHAVWSQIVDGNIFTYWPFGRWELMLADFVEDGGVPALVNRRDITPRGMPWNEPGNFHPDGVRLLLSGSTEKDAQGMDQYILDVRSGALVNLTQSPTVWDEHGQFSPDGERIIFMSAHPYRQDPNSSKVLSIRTEFMLMNADGSGLVQLTHFAEKGYPEHVEKYGIAANPVWSRDGRSAQLLELFFPYYEYWDLVFEGACGHRRAGKGSS